MSGRAISVFHTRLDAGCPACGADVQLAVHVENTDHWARCPSCDRTVAWKADELRPMVARTWARRRAEAIEQARRRRLAAAEPKRKRRSGPKRCGGLQGPIVASDGHGCVCARCGRPVRRAPNKERGWMHAKRVRYGDERHL